jgi:WD40 repeat protein
MVVHPVLVSGHGDGTVRMWRSDTGEPLSQHDWVGGIPCSLAVACSGTRRLVAAGGDEGFVQVWDADTGRTVHRLWTDGGRGAVAMGGPPERVLIAAGGLREGAGFVRLWDAQSGKELRSLPVRRQPNGFGFGAGVNGVALGGHDGRYFLAAAVEDGTVRIWPTHGGGWRQRARLGRRFSGHRRMAWSVAVGRAGDRLVVVSGGSEGRVIVRPANGRGSAYQLDEITHWARCVDIARVGSQDLIAVARDHEKPGIPGVFSSIRMLDATTGDAGYVLFPSTPHGINAVRFGTYLGRTAILAGCAGGTILAWDALTKEPMPALEVGNDLVSALAFS